MSKQSTNDKTILSLKKQIEEKKKALKTSEKFIPVTNCSVEIGDTRYNIHTLQITEVINLLVLLNTYKLSAEDLGMLEEFKISGYTVTEWITDLQTKRMILTRKAEENKLRAMEEKLHNLLSNEKKIELEIEEIASSL